MIVCDFFSQLFGEEITTWNYLSGNEFPTIIGFFILLISKSKAFLVPCF